MDKFAKLLGCVAVSGLAGLIGSLATFQNVKTWYPTLVKPSFNPPAWLFGPVWTLLYIMMGAALFLVWESPARDKRAAVVFFFLQLALNALWSVVFFGMHSPKGGLAVIAALWALIIATMITFFRINPAAGWLLAPYLAWVSFASVLNAAIWRLNQ